MCFISTNVFFRSLYLGYRSVGRSLPNIFDIRVITDITIRALPINPDQSIQTPAPD